MGKPRSDALAAVHETTAGLAKAGVITKQTMTSIYRKIKNSFLVDSDTDRAESTISGVRRQVPCHGAGDDSPATLKSYPLRGWDEPRPEGRQISGD